MTAFDSLNYDFYTAVYLGSVIEVEEFPELAARAKDYIAGVTRGLWRRVPERDWTALKKAACAVAEILRDERCAVRRAFAEKPVESEKVGEYSVAYGSAALSGAEKQYLEERKRETLKVYLSGIPTLKCLFEVRSMPCMHHIR